MKIYTLTLNPAFDLHCKTEYFSLGHESFFDVLSCEAGGKGVNISRALLSGGVNNTAIVVVGNQNGQEFCNNLNNDKIDYIPVFVEGRIRENIVLHDKTDVETRVSFNGFAVDKTLFNAIISKLDFVDENTIITLTGSVPKGLCIEEIKSFVKYLQDKGCKVVIDSRSFSLEDLIEIKPFLIKPNQDEISHYLKEKIDSPEKAKKVANVLFNKGIQNALISLGGDGAVLGCKEGVFYVKSVNVPVVSTIGAGDSSVAGFIKAFVEGKTSLDCLKTAVAFGSAACMTEGTKPPKIKDIEHILSLMK